MTQDTSGLVLMTHNSRFLSIFNRRPIEGQRSTRTEKGTDGEEDKSNQVKRHSICAKYNAITSLSLNDFS